MDRATAEALNLDVSCTLLTPAQQQVVDGLRRRVAGSLELFLRALDEKEPARRQGIIDAFKADKADKDKQLKAGLTVAAAVVNVIPVVGQVMSAILAVAATMGAAQGPFISPQPPREWSKTLGSYRGFSPLMFLQAGRGITYQESLKLADPILAAAVKVRFAKYVDAKLDAYSRLLGVELRCAFPRYHVAHPLRERELQLLEGDAEEIATWRALADPQGVNTPDAVPRFLIDDLPEEGTPEWDYLVETLKKGGTGVGDGQVPPLPLPPPPLGTDPERGRAWDLIFWAISRNVLVPQVSALRALLGNVVIGARREDNPYGFPIGPFRPDPVRAWEWNQGYDDAAARRAAPTGSLPYLSGALDQMIGTARSANPYGVDSGQPPPPDPYRDRLRRDRGRLRGYDDGGGLFDAFRATAELIGAFNGSPPARLWRTFELVAFDGRGNVVALGAPQARTYRLSKDPAVGSGLAGAPGAWDQVTGGVPPGNFGLPARVLGRDATGRARPMSARFLRIKLGPSWAALLTR